MSRHGHSQKIQSQQTQHETDTMTYDEQKLDLDPTIIILGLVYASSILLAIGWVASL